MSYTSKQNYKRNRSAHEPEGLPKTPLKVQDNQEQEEQKSELDCPHRRGTAMMKLRLHLRRLRRKRRKRIIEER